MVIIFDRVSVRLNVFPDKKYFKRIEKYGICTVNIILNPYEFYVALMDYR